ncbi:uncharacterized protein MAM_03202 [Metarhizium album ARSEF 1941]|uniref:Esterase, SGNH hydrolase-type, subgroup n=1 Tax=Metarhizium album (strain ARSEF 1941) TaxID=1081103 RepID=A0A0B2X120_METAS|nr:uncharacterized protein MAM_03202 [Metarhizium album ARSEF 1941]KHN98740.1 hypothetical protein MAM_03202 [Metarhizium album ARSEF 1941]
MGKKINASRFYLEYKGHTISDVTAFRETIISQRPTAPIVYLAGDSSLDNKYWLPSSSPGGEPLPAEVPEIYKFALEPPHPKPDVAFWLNHFLGSRATALNLAVEASLLRERDGDLLAHDTFIRDHIRADDFLVVSVGANDIAMRPNLSTICHMLLLAWLTPTSRVRNGTACALRYFVNMFKTQVEKYVCKLVEKHKPRAVIVCMIYFPLEAQAANQPSWADISLGALGYNRWPGRLQAAITTMYEVATKKVRIPGVSVIPLSLSEALDGKLGGDYVERVEPSVEGGRKMASRLAAIIDPLLETVE